MAASTTIDENCPKNNPALPKHQSAERGRCHCQCPKSFRSEAALKDHSHSCHIYRCGACICEFQDEGSLQRHQQGTGHCYCQTCSCSFARTPQLQEHRQLTHPRQCYKCGREFRTEEGRKDHQRSTVHCLTCPCFCIAPEKLVQHREAVHHHPCSECNRIFEMVEALHQHQRATGHSSARETRKMRSVGQTRPAQHGGKVRASQFSCLECKRDFKTETALNQHLKDKKGKHSPKLDLEPLPDGSYHCRECDRTFRQRQAMEQHLASLIHNPLSSMRCIASSKCKRNFTSPSALLHHLESGSCRSGLKRAAIHRLIQDHDLENTMTFGTQGSALLLPAREDLASSDSGSSGQLTPSSHASDTYPDDLGVRLRDHEIPGLHLSPDEVQPITNAAGKFLCPLCHGKSRVFRSLQAFRNHTASPAHEPKIFHCPVSLVPGPKVGKKGESLIKEFSTLGGMAQHIESGSCEGGRQMLERAAEFVERKLRELGFGEVRLLK